MNNSPFKVVWLKAFISFLIPLLTALVGSLSPYSLTGAVPPNHFAMAIIAASALIAGASALSSFLSTSFSDHKAKKEAGLTDDAPLPITGAQVKNTPPSPMPPAIAPIEPISSPANPKPV